MSIAWDENSSDPLSLFAISADVEGWVKDKNTHGDLHRKAIASLLALGVFRSGTGSMRLDPTFQSQIQASLAQGALDHYEAPLSVLMR